jgi:hypothetical protein
MRNVNIIESRKILHVETRNQFSLIHRKSHCVLAQNNISNIRSYSMVTHSSVGWEIFLNFDHSLQAIVRELS